MAVSIPEFWNLLVASRLASPNSIPRLQDQFSHVKGAETQSNAVTLAQWLIAQGALSRYQAKVLLAGHPGPFSYGDYNVYDRHAKGRLEGGFRALHPATRFRVMLWFHAGPAAQHPQWWPIASQQTALLSRAIHPNLARVYHIVDSGEFKFTALEDLQGVGMDEWLAGGPIPWAVACRMIRQTALGLAKLTTARLVHNAVRPQNLWIDEQENIKLMLPPLARDPAAMPRPIDLAAKKPGAELTRQSDYLAPELAQPANAPGPQTDVYALGCTMFHLLSGRPPYTGRDVLSKLASHASERIPSLESAGVPQQVSQVVGWMMAKDPSKRFRQPADVAGALEQVLEKLDPSQLNWPASSTQNKLPEYEAWLQPYTLASESHQNWIPEIPTPPILEAAFRQPSEPRHEGISLDPPKAATSAAPKPTAKSPPAAPTRSAATAPASSQRAPAAAVQPANVPPERPKAQPSAPATDPRSLTPGSQVLDQMVFPPDDINIFSTPTKREPREPRQEGNSQRKKLITGGAVAACILVVLLLGFVFRKHSGEPPKPADTPTASSVTTIPTDGGAQSSSVGNPSTMQETKGATEAKPEPNEKGAQGNDSANDSEKKGADKSASKSRPPQVVPDDGQSLWVSPTQGTPISLSHFAPGVQAALILRPADLLRQPDGEKTLAALGPDAEALRRELESVCGAPLSEVDQLVIGWIDQMSDAAAPAIEPMFVFHFSKPVDVAKQLSSWGLPAESGISESTVFQTPQGFAANWARKDPGKILVLGPTQSIQDAAKSAGSPPPLRREIEKLLLATDDKRLATLLWLPSSTDAAGKNPAGQWDRLLAGVQHFFGEDARAAALSAHLSGDNLFLELRIQGPLDRAPDVVDKQFRSRLNRLPSTIEDFVATLNMQQYGKKVLLRLPPMVKVLDEFTRGGVEGDQAVLRCYLPAVAAQNLFLGSELALAEGASSGPPGTTGGGTGKDGGSKPPETVRQKLKHVTSLTFARDTLERAIQLLADDIGIKAEILGPDLQLEGITKNQSFGLDEKDKPAAEILRDIMVKANPDGKLVYVVKPRQPGGEEELFVTTRAAAAKRGDQLPAELAIPPKGK